MSRLRPTNQPKVLVGFTHAMQQAICNLIFNKDLECKYCPIGFRLSFTEPIESKGIRLANMHNVPNAITVTSLKTGLHRANRAHSQSDIHPCSKCQMHILQTWLKTRLHKANRIHRQTDIHYIPHLSNLTTNSWYMLRLHHQQTPRY